MTTPDCPEEVRIVSDGAKEESRDTWVLEWLLVLSGLVMAATRQPQPPPPDDGKAKGSHPQDKQSDYLWWLGCGGKR